MAVAVFDTPKIQGEVCFYQKRGGVDVVASFTRLPSGPHGFHIHRAGDLRGEGCKGACDHWHKGRPTLHGGPPTHKGARHTGDLGNLDMDGNESLKKTFFLKGVFIEELYGRSLIIHEDEDDYGRGPHDDSKTTGHSGARIGCAILGRMDCSSRPKADGASSMSTRKKPTK
jgi:superoxide dismutase, Cu-Zn family